MAKSSKRQSPASPLVPRRSEQPKWLFAAGFDREFVSLPGLAISGLSTLMERHAQGLTRVGTHFKPLADGLYELRYEHSNNHFRLIFKWDEGDLVALTAFAKNQEKIPRKDLKRAATRSASWARPKPDTPVKTLGRK